MTRFIEGPAHGVTLSLASAPMMLRVVISSTGEIDALDNYTDTPKATETIHVYERIEKEGQVGMCHVLRRGKGQRSVWYLIATYKFVCTPLDAEVRDNRLWVEWCEMRAQG